MSDFSNKSYPHKVRKRFGQHFLNDTRIVEKIVESVKPRYGDTLIEVGPGRGVLTRQLLRRFPSLFAVEIDRDLSALLRSQFAEELLHLIEADVLNLNWSKVLGDAGGKKLFIVGNLPYNITGPFLFKLINEADYIREAVLMLQREVAQRLAAQPGGKDYGQISVLLGVRVKVELISEVSRSAFRPPPRVDSSVLRFCFAESPYFDIKNMKNFSVVVKSAFGQRRKMLRNSLRSLAENKSNQFLAEWGRVSGIDFTRRPEQLEIEEFVRLSNALSMLREA